MRNYTTCCPYHHLMGLPCLSVCSIKKKYCEHFVYSFNKLLKFMYTSLDINSRSRKLFASVIKYASDNSVPNLYNHHEQYYNNIFNRISSRVIEYSSTQVVIDCRTLKFERRLKSRSDAATTDGYSVESEEGIIESYEIDEENNSQNTGYPLA